jgi:outer membrane receptor protein involved in Fe transport
MYFGDGRWRIEAWGKNLSDEVYQVHIIPFLGDRFATYGTPRTYGVTLAVDW